MKFGWLVVGILMGIPGILIAWLSNAGNVDKVRSDAVKFAVIGMVVNIVLALFVTFTFGAMLASIASYASYY